MSQPQKCTFWEKDPKDKNLTLLLFVTTAHDFALKIETGWSTRVAKSILKTRNDNDKC